MLDDLFTPDALTAARDQVLRPPPVPKQAATFSAWKTTTAAPRGVAAGANQSAGFLADIVGAFGQVSATAYSGDMLGNITPAQRQEVAQATDKLRTQGVDFSSEAGDSFRAVARDYYSPDAATAHASERLLFDASRIITKAVGYSAISGNPFAGAALTAGDEGMTVADDLKQQGVDLGTRTKVGAIVGGVTGLSVALPMAGQTVKQTVGLVAAGGPGSFIAQQAAVREVLNSAGYESLAEQYDPFDPVGLTMATLLPAGFGAWGVRAAKARSAREALLAEQQAAREFAQGPIPSAETPTAAAARAAFSPEQVDAARVLLAVEQRAKANPGAADDMRAQQAHDSAMTRAEDQLAAGERVNVADVAPRVESMGPVAIPAEISRVPVQIVKRKGVDAVDVAKTEATLPPVAEGYVRLYRGESPTVKFSDVFDVAQLTGERAPQIPGARYTPDLKYADYYRSSYGKDATVHYIDVPQAVADAGKVSEYEYKVDVDAVNAARRLTDSPYADWSQQVAAAVREIRQAIEEAQPNAPRTAQRPEATPAPANPQAADAAGAGRAAGAPAAPADSGTGAAAPKAGLVDDAPAMRAQALAAEQPDLMVQLDGMDAPRPLSDVLAAVKAEADDMVMDGQLFEVAAACALQVGA